MKTIKPERIPWKIVISFVSFLFASGLGISAALSAPMDSKDQWEKVVREAKKEGKVSVLGPRSAEIRPPVMNAFQKAFPGIEIEIQAGSLGRLATRFGAELKQGKTSMDVVVGGTSALRSKDLLDPLLPKLILREAIDADKWHSSKGSGLKWIDQKQQYVVQTSEMVFGYVLVNTKMAGSGAIKSWRDLLKSDWKGKITSHDPRGSGAGQEVAGYLLLKLGDSFVTELFKNQKVELTRSYTQIADWVAQGKFAIGIAQLQGRIEQLKKEGFPLDAYSLPDAPGTLTGGFSTLSLLKGAPHPNAAIVFANWFLTKEAQEAFHRPILFPSLRTDVPTDYVPSYVMPKPGSEYLDVYTEKFQSTRRKLGKQVISAIGR